MKFRFDRAAAQNIRKSLRKEWLLSNGLGGYASSSLVCCNTRGYHGLLVVNVPEADGRHVLLSTLEESLEAEGRELFFSCRKHPGRYWPHGHEYIQEAEFSAWPRFVYRFGDVELCREFILKSGTNLLLIRYTAKSVTGAPLPRLNLTIKPLLAFRHFHKLTHANIDLQVKTYPVSGGFNIRPYNSLPPLFMQTDAAFRFFPAPDWYYNIEYLIEEERGLSHTEDLFRPGIFNIELEPDQSIHISASTAEIPNAPTVLTGLWNEQAALLEDAKNKARHIEGHLAREATRYSVHLSGYPTIIAGYHWFGSWGRDTFISLPGLMFCTGRIREGVEVLRHAANAAHNGLIPNLMGENGRDFAYNSVDASLWYVWAVQQMLFYAPDTEHLMRDVFAPAIRKIIEAYIKGRAQGLIIDDIGLPLAGTPDTQLTWMDAQVNGQPVTPRNGCPVEIAALWYNALAFSNQLAERWDEPKHRCEDKLHQMRTAFVRRFLLPNANGLADVWRPGQTSSAPDLLCSRDRTIPARTDSNQTVQTGIQDRCVRPNQLFAVSLPFPILEDEELQRSVVERARVELLTPYGLRTLSPSAPDYHPVYEGNPAERDAAYHQGTVWPWLLGAYTDALMRVSRNKEHAARELLNTIRPLLTQHLEDAGIGSISEIFSADPPHLPDGCIAQAWSCGECLRLLSVLKQYAPAAYTAFNHDISKGDA